MKLSTREDLEMPIEAVFAAISDFDAFERRAIRRGADIARTDRLAEPAVGMAWDVSFKYRGRTRTMTPKVTKLESPSEMEILSETSGLEALLGVELVSLSPARTRMVVGLEMKPHSLSARLLVQSLKLAKANLTKRFRESVADYASGLEIDHNGPPTPR